MSEFKTGFVDVYRPNMVAMLDMAERLPFSHVPDTAIRTNILQDQLEISFKGTPIADLSPVEKEDSELRNILATHVMHMDSLKILVATQLVASESARIDEGLTESRAEQKDRMNGIRQSAKDAVSYADASYSYFEFYDENTSTAFSLISYNLIGLDSPVGARYLTLNIVGEQVTEGLTISELPESLAGERVLDIEHYVRPIENEVMSKAIKTFQDNGLDNGLEIFTQMYEAALYNLGFEGLGLDEIEARFNANNNNDQLMQIIEDVKKISEEVKDRIVFSIENPELKLPSYAQLERFQDLLTQLVS